MYHIFQQVFDTGMCKTQCHILTNNWDKYRTGCEKQAQEYVIKLCIPVSGKETVQSDTIDMHIGMLLVLILPFFSLYNVPGIGINCKTWY